MIPILLIGAPGTGKTAAVRARYTHTEVLLLSAAAEEDVAGLPYIIDGRERRTTPAFVERLQAAARQHGPAACCLFLDELDKARREVADTLLTLVTHPESYGIPAGVAIVAACNPPEWGGGDGISEPMLSRFAAVRWQPQVAVVADYLAARHGPAGEYIADGLRTGRIPLYETAGEGLGQRITCPRTYELALRAMVEPSPLAPLDLVLAGLLTVNAASYLAAYSTPAGPVEVKARRVAARRQATAQPVRVP